MKLVRRLFGDTYVLLGFVTGVVVLTVLFSDDPLWVDVLIYSIILSALGFFISLGDWMLEKRRTNQGERR